LRKREFFSWRYQALLSVIGYPGGVSAHSEDGFNLPVQFFLFPFQRDAFAAVFPAFSPPPVLLLADFVELIAAESEFFPFHAEPFLLEFPAPQQDDAAEEIEVLGLCHVTILITHAAMMAWMGKNKKPTVGFSARFFLEGCDERLVLKGNGLQRVKSQKIEKTRKKV
jgi:hypothetical protein